MKDGGLAQLGEHLPCKQGVESSNLLVSTSGEKAAERTLKTEYRETKIQSKKFWGTAGAVTQGKNKSDRTTLGAGTRKKQCKGEYPEGKREYTQWNSNPKGIASNSKRNSKAVPKGKAKLILIKG